MNRDRIDEAIRHLSVWARRSPWQRLWDEVLEQHVGAVARKAGLDHDALEAELGHHAHMMLLGCAFEDLLSHRADERGRNIIDDYLDQRAWREPPVVREYLRALRDSVMSLYEVVDKVPGTHLVLRDLVRGGEPVTVDERLGSLSTARWDRLGVRVLRVGERNVLSGGLLHFPFEAAERVLRVLRAGTGAMEAGMPQEMLDADARDRIAGAARGERGPCLLERVSRADARRAARTAAGDGEFRGRPARVYDAPVSAGDARAARRGRAARQGGGARSDPRGDGSMELEGRGTAAGAPGCARGRVDVWKF